MKTLALCALALVACVPNVPGGGCSPLVCASSQVALAGGTLLGIRASSDAPLRVLDLRTGTIRRQLPAGMLAGRTLVHQQGTLVTWRDVVTGAKTATARLPLRFTLVGVSQDGKRAVARSASSSRTTFVVVSAAGQRRVTLAKAAWDFDALSGDNLYLLQYLEHGYVVRRFDIPENKLAAQPLKDASESAVIQGTPWAQLSSADGRYLFTLYITPQGKAMVHQLDTRSAIARCVDLPGVGDFNSAATYALTLDPDGSTLWAVGTGYGKVVAIDIERARARTTFDFLASAPAAGVRGTAAVSPDGKRLAVVTGSSLWFVTLAERSVTRPRARYAVALGFSPDGRRLWTVGRQSRVTAVRVP